MFVLTLMVAIVAYWYYIHVRLELTFDFNTLLYLTPWLCTDIIDHLYSFSYLSVDMCLTGSYCWLYLISCLYVYISNMHLYCSYVVHCKNDLLFWQLHLLPELQLWHGFKGWCNVSPLWDIYGQCGQCSPCGVQDYGCTSCKIVWTSFLSSCFMQ